MSAVTEIAARAHGLALVDYQAEVCSTLFALLHGWEPPTDLRSRVIELAYEAVGTAPEDVGGLRVTVRRRWRVRDWLVRTWTPAWIEAVSVEQATKLRALDPVLIQSVLEDVRVPLLDARKRAERAMTGLWDRTGQDMEAVVEESFLRSAWHAVRDASDGVHDPLWVVVRDSTYYGAHDAALFAVLSTVDDENPSQASTRAALKSTIGVLARSMVGLIQELIL